MSLIRKKYLQSWRKCAAVISLAFLLTLTLGAASSYGAFFQGSKMENYAATFGLQGDGVVVQETAFEINGQPCANLLWPGEKSLVTFHIKVAGGYNGPVKFDVVQYGTRSIPGEMWKPHCFKIADIASSSVAVNLPPGGGFVNLHPTFGETFGGYAIVVDIPGHGRFFGGTFCRVPNPEPGRVYMPKFAMDLGWPADMSPALFNSFKKMGIKGARINNAFGDAADIHADWAMQNDITVLMTEWAGPQLQVQPLNRGRPWLTSDGSLMNGRKEDMAWLPQYDPQFREYLTNVLNQYGWPNGPINAVELWNEPWEGVSISNWGADILRFREIYRVMAQAVLDARKESGVKVLIGGADSSGNTRDKLFCDGTDEFLNILDFVSMHYQALSADGALERKWINRTGEYGRVRAWDTESWIGNSDDRIAAIIASMRSIGQDRATGIAYFYVNDPQKPKIDGRQFRVCQVWAPGAAIAAADKMIGQREFKQILFKNGLPWVFEFNGLPGQPGNRTGNPNVDDSTMVIVGDLTQTYDQGKCLFRSVSIKPDARLEIPDGDGTFILYDFYGNPIPSNQGKITVPINGLGYFLRTNGAPGSFANLEAAIKTAAISGVDPVEIVPRDMTAPLSSKPAIRIAITNVLNRPITGRLSAKVEGLTLNPPDQSVSLGANETRDFPFVVDDGPADPDNNYPLVVTFDGPDGAVQHNEVIHVNYIAKRTITIDGSLDDWKGAIPQTMAGAVGTSMTEKAYLPFKSWDTKSSSGAVTAYLGYDDNFFYFAAKVPEVVPTIRYGERDDDSFFYPETVTDKGRQLTWPAGVRHYSYRKNPDLPEGHNVQIAFNVIPEDQKPEMIAYPPGTMPRFCCYPDTDYEYALNKCKDGGAEIFCLYKPGATRKSFYPRQPKAPVDGGPVPDPAKLIFNGNVLECAIPWTEMPEVHDAIAAGNTIKFTFRSNEGGPVELAAGRSVSKINSISLHPDFTTHWANELEFGVEK